jgi:hypothetical protein
MMPRKIFLIFLAFGVAIAGGSSFYYAWCWSEVQEGRSWPTTIGTILSTDVEDHTNQDSSNGRSTTIYYPRLSYAYRVGSRALRGERVWLSGEQFYNHREDAEAFVRNYAIGQSVPVVYDPRDPADAALLIVNPPWQVLLFTAFGLLWIALSLYFRLAGPPKRRFGRCRSCGAVLPFDEHGSVSGALPAGLAAQVPAPGGLPCPRCGRRDPLNSLRNKKGLIAFLVLFVAIWAILLTLMFVM